MNFLKPMSVHITSNVGNCDSEIHLHYMTWNEIKLENVCKCILNSGRMENCRVLLSVSILSLL